VLRINPRRLCRHSAGLIETRFRTFAESMHYENAAPTPAPNSVKNAHQPKTIA
jgi:hypothetical protein